VLRDFLEAPHVPFIEEENKIGHSLSVANNRTVMDLAADDVRRGLDA
jgi:hypothetical protein